MAMYVQAKIIYDGRAYSELENGNYLIIHKSDKSISVHAANKITPRNYQPANCKTTIIKQGDKYLLTSKNKRETIYAHIDKILWVRLFRDWSTNNISITRTEADLVKKIVNNPLKYIGFIPDEIHTEYKTEVGPIDICMIKDSIKYIIEVKRNKISIGSVVQLRKYLEVVDAIGYVAAPIIATNALTYCNKYGLKYIKVEFEE